MVTKSRWDSYYKMQKSGKRNMVGYDITIQKNYEAIFKHFEEDKKTEDWRN